MKQLRQNLKQKWLNYCQENLVWLVKMRIWRDYDGVRRPSSGYILATLSILEPQFKQILPFLLDLNNDPDRIVAALGLNFNPDEELRLLQLASSTTNNQILHKSPIPEISHSDRLIKQDQVSTGVQNHKQVLLRVAPNLQAKHQSVKNNSSVSRGDTGKQTHRSVNGRSPTITTPLTTSVSTSSKSASSPISLSEFNFKYEFTGIPVKEVCYISSTTNARSLPAWMDEFCPGVR